MAAEGRDPTDDEVRDAQARLAERMDVEPGGRGVRHVLLDGRRVGKVVHDGELTWSVHLLVDGVYEDLYSSLLGGPDDEEEADRLGVGWVAFELAERGER